MIGREDSSEEGMLAFDGGTGVGWVRALGDVLFVYGASVADDAVAT